MPGGTIWNTYLGSLLYRFEILSRGYNTVRLVQALQSGTFRNFKKLVFGAAQFTAGKGHIVTRNGMCICSGFLWAMNFRDILNWLASLACYYPPLGDRICCLLFLPIRLLNSSGPQKWFCGPPPLAYSFRTYNVQTAFSVYLFECNSKS